MLHDATAQANGSGAASVSGAAAFELYDTYGFPLELTQEYAAEQGIAVSLSSDARTSHTPPLCVTVWAATPSQALQK